MAILHLHSSSVLRLVIRRFALTALAASLWSAAVLCRGAEFAANLPDFVTGLGFALTLSFGVWGWLGAMGGWLLCQQLAITPEALFEPASAAVFFAVLGGLVLPARGQGLGERPRQPASLLAIWVFAAITVALVMASTALIDKVGHDAGAFFRELGLRWLDALAGTALVLVPFWRALIPSPAFSTSSASSAWSMPDFAAGWMWLAGVALMDMALALWLYRESVYPGVGLPLVVCMGVLSAAVMAALGAGLAGVGWQGLLLVWMLLALAGRSPLTDGLYPAVFALAQILATLVAVIQEQRWLLLERQRGIEHHAALRDRAALYELIAEHSADVISVHFANFDFQYASPQLHRLLGLAPDDRPGPIAMLLPRLHPADRPQALPENLPDQGRFRFRIRGGDLHWHWLESLYSAQGQGESRRYVVVTRDIGAHVEQTETLHAMALHDPMTQLYNRRAAGSLGERLWEEALARRMPFAVIMLDIDHFKKINDTFGHDVGDEAIKRVAAILPEHVRQRDMVCRWGGEEFLMLLPESDVEGAYQIAERVRGEVASTVLMAQGRQVLLRISAGVTQRTEGDATLAEVIERADQGLYAAKEQGRNRVVPMRKSA